MANRLIDETSPYLLQHAHNPVDWYPWGEDAFEAARTQDKPILLSVGYSACHWCHVMERESFCNELIAARMNRGFISVKVDREERPDVDELYMRAVQALNQGQGGWPMTVFLTPEGRAFFGGTYFPPTTRHDNPGFGDVLDYISSLWRDGRDEVDRRAAEVDRVLARTGHMPAPAPVLTHEWLEPLARAAQANADLVHGGFGGAPKFPPHATLTVLLAHHHRTGEEVSLDLVTSALDGMAKGGMHDLLGGGFARYSVDAQWRVPHFEKMLYDNAQLLGVYTDAWRLTQSPAYARVARNLVGWAMREMHLDRGGFAASQDADSEGREGAYFVWTPEEITDVLSHDAARVCQLLGVTADGTFEEGRSVLRSEVPFEALSSADQSLLERAMPKLAKAREQREAPARDDKVITSWNALMVSGLAKAAVAFEEPGWTQLASETAQFLLEQCRTDGRLMRTHKDDRSHIPAFADDHANLITALLDLWDATFESRWLDEALALADALVELFWDEQDGGLFLTGSDQPELVHRSKPIIGGAEPSANGVAALAFLRLGRLCGREDLLEKAERISLTAQQLLGQAARALGPEALAGSWLADGGLEVAIIGDPEAEATRALVAELRSHVLPFAVTYVGAEPDVARMPWLEGKTAIDGVPTAFVCEGYTCRLPVRDVAGLSAQLEEGRIREPKVVAPVANRPPAAELPSDPDVWLRAGEHVPSLESLRGHVVVLDFWTYCCVNCHHVLPELQALQARFAEDPVVVLGVHSAKFEAEKQRDNVATAMQRHDIRHPVLLDPDHVVWEAYGVRSWPTLVILDAEGRVAAQRSGESDVDELSVMVQALVEEARAAGTAASEPLTPVSDDGEGEGEATAGAELRFPGKVHVWPNAWDQEMGAKLDDTTAIYVSDSGNHQILEVSFRLEDGWPALTVLRRFGSGTPGLSDGSAEQACFRSPQGTARHENTLYVADTENHALRAVDLTTGEVTTLAGTGERGTQAPTPELLATPLQLALRSPWDVEVMTFKHHHLVFVAMAGSHQIWVYGGGHMGLHAGSGREDHVDGPAAASALAQPSSLALYGRYLLFADSEVSSIRAVDLQAHQLVTVVGRGLFDFGDVDGAADVVRLQHPLGLTFAGETVYVADTYNHKIKHIALTDGTTKTLCGGETSELREPGGIARIGEHLLIADTSNHRLRAARMDTGELRDVPILSS
ncbi:MAG: DUF255 domain-containing protein [Myxococcales bacterium]|nr:DUF255 domain-containing protein [Myxococcales bacterium]